MSLLGILSALIPHWTRDDWAVEQLADGSVEVVKTLDYVRPGETFDGIVTLSNFSWFGFCWGGDGETLMRPWVNPHDEVRND